MDVLGIELAPAILLGIGVWLTVVVALMWIGLRTRKAVMEGKSELKAFATEMAERYEKRFDTMFAEAKPFLSKVNAAVENLPSLDPGKLAVAFEPMLVDLFDARVGPWASKMGNDMLAQIDTRVEHMENVFRPLINMGNKLFSSAGGTAKAEKVRNKEVADNIRGRIPAGLLSLLPKNLKVTDDAEELINGLMQFKPLADRFAPGLLDQFLLGTPEGTVQPTGILGMPGIFPGVSAVKSNETVDDLSNYGK